MKYGSIILEKKEYIKLKRLLNFHKYYEDYAHKDALEQLKERTGKALIEEDENIPNDIVRLTSKVTVEFNNGTKSVFDMVSPNKECLTEKKISVLSTLGSNLIGLSINDTIRIGVPSDIKTLKIIKVETVSRLSKEYLSEVDF